LQVLPIDAKAVPETAMDCAFAISPSPDIPAIDFSEGAIWRKPAY
jgi:hypothetical protein